MTHHEHNGEDELQAARRTAHALGQTSDAERAAVAAEVAASPQARQEFQELEALAARLKEAARLAPQPAASPELRQAIEERLAQLVPAAGRAAAINSAPRPAWRRWRRRLASLAVTVCLMALTVLIGLYGANRHRDVAMSPNAKDFATTGATLARQFLERSPADRPMVDRTGHFDIIPSRPVHNDRGEGQAGLMGGLYGTPGNDNEGEGCYITGTRPVGTGALTKTGVGTVVLSGANSYMYLGYHTGFSDGALPGMGYEIDPIRYDVRGRTGSGQTFDGQGSADLFTSDLSIAYNPGVGTGAAGYAGFGPNSQSGLTQMNGSNGSTDFTVANGGGSYPLIVYALIQDPNGTPDVAFDAGGITGIYSSGLGRVDAGENFHRFPMSGSPANGDGKSDVLAETSGRGMSQFDGVPIVGRVVQRQSAMNAGTTTFNAGSPIIYPDPERITFNNLSDNYTINGGSRRVADLATRGRFPDNGEGQVNNYFHTPFDQVSRYREPAEGLTETGRSIVQTSTFQGTDSTTTDTMQNGIVNQAENLFNNNSNHATTAHTGVTVSLSGSANYTGGTVVTAGKQRLNVLQTTIDGTRQEIKVAVDTRNATQTQLIDTNDKLLNFVAEPERLEKLNRELTQRLTEARLPSSASPGFGFNNGRDMGNSSLGWAMHPLDAASQNPPTTTGLFTSDLSVPFSQGSYALGVPQFGGFVATVGATGDSGQGVAASDGERRAILAEQVQKVETEYRVVQQSSSEEALRIRLQAEEVRKVDTITQGPANTLTIGGNGQEKTRDESILRPLGNTAGMRFVISGTNGGTSFVVTQQTTSEEGTATTGAIKKILEEERKADATTLGPANTLTIGALTSPAAEYELFRNTQKALIASRFVIDSKPAQGIRIAPKIPIESWKPARVVPNSSRLMVGDKEELPIKGMQVDVRVDGFRARVLIDLYYFNDRPQQLEGNFQLRLPDEASPYFFAFGRTVYQAPQVTANDSMFFKPQQVSQGDTTPEKILALRGNSWDEPKVARMVPKEKAALAYRDTVRRRVDPALVEWSGAGVFQCRVFPLAPQSLHRVTVGYDVDLTRVGDDLELRLDLPGQAPATIVDLNIAASDARQVSLDAPATALTPGPSPGGRGETSRLSYRLVDPKERPLMVRLRKPGMQMLTGNDEATGSFFATRAALTLPETPAEVRSKQAVFLVDTSLSAGPQFPLWNKLLRATLENNRDQIKQFAVLFFNVETFWWQEKFVPNTPENVEALMKYADGLALEGATDLGRALKEAAAPKWQPAGEGPAPDMFLLSDGAATWGEDRWPLLAAELKTHVGGDQPALTPGPSPIRPSTADGRGESCLFAYRTGLAGGDPRLLAYLAQQTGGAVFSLTGEAEIAPASVAHRNRPWKLTAIEMAGGHDLLVAGRPQYVFPGQQLLVVGRLNQNRTDQTDRTDPSEPPALVFTLQQGKATKTISLKPEQMLTSELAARTFGQVATSQLEDVSGVAAAAEPVATAYARHFRVTGRTCSLLMLESEQDYARFNIKPEEDSFVVKDRPASPIVTKAVSEATTAMSDPKASFLAWYRRLQQSSEVHFDLPAALNVAVEGLSAEAFAVTPAALVCKLRLRSDLPQNLRQPWQSGMPDYDTLTAEAQRRLTAYGADDAIRALSSLVEERPGDAVLQRDLAFSAIEWQRPGEAYHLLRRAAQGRSFESISFHALAHCLEQMGKTELAIIYYELACGGQWDARFGDMHNIAQLDYLRFLRRVASGQIKTSLADYAQARLATLSHLQLRDTADVAALIFWNTDGTDVDLHVIEPSGEECFYQHTQTASGGHISRDVTTGFGPELYLLPAAPSGKYEISAHYFATDANRASTRTKVLALIYENWGTKDERLAIKAIALTGQKENQPLTTVKR